MPLVPTSTLLDQVRNTASRHVARSLASAVLRDEKSYSSNSSNKNNKNNNTTGTAVTSGSSQMLSHEYQRSSHNQYSSHHASHDLLTQCIKRVASRRHAEQQHWVDLGSADGTNSLTTMEYCLKIATESNSSNNSCKTHITFSDHPDSDQQLLEETIAQSPLWKTHPEASHSVHMQSFYEQIFPNQSVDLALSHICVHWLDRANVQDFTHWKQLVRHDASLSDFTNINELTCPTVLRQAWQEQLATPHLSNFYQCRAKELKLHGECFVTMPATPHQFIVSKKGNGSAILTRALRACVDQGRIPASVLERTIVPFYLRTVPDVEQAVEHANQALLRKQPAGTGAAPPRLELVNVRSDLTRTGNEAEGPVGTSNLFWSIIAGSVRAAGLLPHQEQHVKQEVDRIFAQDFGASGIVEGHFISATVKRVQ